MIRQLTSTDDKFCLLFILPKGKCIFSLHMECLRISCRHLMELCVLSME